MCCDGPKTYHKINLMTVSVKQGPDVVFMPSCKCTKLAYRAEIDGVMATGYRAISSDFHEKKSVQRVIRPSVSREVAAQPCHYDAICSRHVTRRRRSISRQFRRQIITLALTYLSTCDERHETCMRNNW